MKAIKFWFTLLLGALAGGAIVTNLDERQREQLKARTRRATSSGRTGKVASTVTTGVSDVADAAADRVSDVVDQATTAVTQRLSTDETNGAAHQVPSGQHTAP